MADLDQMAANLYGSDDEQDKAVESPANETVESLDDKRANSMYGEPKEESRGNPYALEQDTADALYGASNTVHLPDMNIDRLISDGGEAETLRSNLGYMAAEGGASAEDVVGLVNIANDIVSSAPAFAESEARREEIISEVLGSFEHDRSKLDDARDLVATYPDLADWLSKTGAGDDPRFVRKMIQLSQTPRGRARIQKYRGNR